MSVEKNFRVLYCVCRFCNMTGFLWWSGRRDQYNDISLFEVKKMYARCLEVGVQASMGVDTGVIFIFKKIYNGS